jgi:large subunit ribosomal protein L35
MDKPIYRYLADKKWRQMDRLILMQRLTQMNVIPDVLPAIDPVMSVNLSFGPRHVQPGEFVDSRVSEVPAHLNIQPYTKGERYVTVAIVNPDVPNVASDAFDYRCHFLASNIKISPTQTSVPIAKLTDEQVILPWLPAYTQKGLAYSRMSIFILEQPQGQVLDAKALSQRYQRKDFILKRFVDRHMLEPVGAGLFRSKFDEGTAGVMKRAGIPGGDVEFKRIKVEPLPYKKLPGSRYR